RDAKHAHGGRGTGSRFGRSGSFEFLRQRFFRWSGRQRNGEHGAAGGERFGSDEPAVLANDGHADAQAEAGAAAGAVGGVEGVEDARQGFGANADAVILKRDANAVAAEAGANLEAAGIADFADGLFGVGDQVEEDLDELVGVGDD